MNIEQAIQFLVNGAIEFNDNNDGEGFDMESFLTAERNKYDTVPKKTGILNHDGHTVDQQIISHLGRLGRYAHFYLKNVLTETIFMTDMDFAFTAILHQYGPLGKTDLIKMMVYEKSSGMEIIKRLIRHGIFEQSINPEDKRSKLIAVTEMGLKEVVKAYSIAGLAPKLVSKPLNDSEKETLLNLLLKLDYFHNEHYLKGEMNPKKILDLNG